MTSQTDCGKAARFACAVCLLLTVVGCGTKLPVVTGTVTLDGKPLADATVIFMPNDETHSPAQGITDASGIYTLEQEAKTAGIQPGAYSVRVTTFQPRSQAVDPPIPAVKERVPVRYNLKTELKANVEADQDASEAPFDFELEASGEIFQPAPDLF